MAIHQGVALRLVVRRRDDTVAVGGRVEYVECRDYFDV
jgi:hypothetical protein